MDFLKSLTVITFIQISTIEATNCFEEFNYHNNYGYGYDITCSNLNQTNIKELENITVYNEIKLSIDKSNLTNLQLFKNIPKIKEVVIENSQLDLSDIFSDETNELKKMAKLSITNSKVQGLSKHTFSGLVNLQILNFTGNNLRDVQFESGLKFSSTIKVIDLSFNNIDDLDDVPLCEFKNLEQLIVRNNYLKSIDKLLIKCIDNVQFLYLDHNRIDRIDSLEPAKFVTRISLSYNKIEGLGQVFNNLKLLNYLNLEGNNLKSIKEKDLSKLFNLQTLNLKNNRIESITSLEALTRLVSLDLSGNNLVNIPNFQFRNLRELFLSNNFMEANLTYRSLRSLKPLKILKFQSCKLRNIDEFLPYLKEIEFLDLAHNNFEISNNSFRGLLNLQTLYLQNNSLWHIPNRCFAESPKLRLLDLSSNNINELTQFTFHNLKELEFLNLSSNFLKHVYPDYLYPLQSLKVIDLENNRIEQIRYVTIIESLPFLKIINIRGNDLPCEFLSSVVSYFHKNDINFTISQRLTYDKENVAGIECNEKDFDGNKRKSGEELQSYQTVNVPLMVAVFITIGACMVVIIAVCLNYSHLIKRKIGNLVTYDDLELLENSNRTYYYGQ